MSTTILNGKKIGVILTLIMILALVSIGPSGMATATAPSKVQAATTLNLPTVNPDGTVTFTLRAPGATYVYLNFQNMVGLSPAYNSYLMTEDASGVWSITMGPTVPGLMGWTNPPAPLVPNWYGYGFNIDGTPPVVPPPNPTVNTTATAVGGVNIADPANRNIWSGATSAWSMVMVPGPAADFIADAAVPHGAVATVRYFSNLTQTERQMQVYTPPGYNHDNRGYPVFYLLHGGGGNDTDWIADMRANYILDNLIAQGMAVPMIVVMPDTNCGPNCSGFLPVLQNMFPQELLGSIVPYIEQNYRTAPGAKNRALAGLSMGGNNTRNTLLQHPGEFAYIGLFSGGSMSQSIIDQLTQNGIDWLSLVAAINRDTKLFWISTGNPTDIAYSGAQTTRALFDQYGVKYTYVDGPTIGAMGGHVWDTWRHHLLAFSQLLFK
jgi:enterochelin esterase-like enzyme